MNESPIQFYLKKKKANATSKEDVNFYLDILRHYDTQLMLYPNDGYKGYGEIPFTMTREDAQAMYDFWFDAMTWFIEREAIERYKKQKENA